jgi:hypothetical protein
MVRETAREPQFIAGASATIRKSNGTRGLIAFDPFGLQAAAEIEGEKKTDAQYVTGGHK